MRVVSGSRAARAGTTLALVLACFSACKSDDPGTSGYWLDRLNKRGERAEALKQLGKIGDKKALPEVLKWFKEDGDWQAEAAYALGQLGDQSVVQELIAGLDPKANRDAHKKNRKNIQICHALGLLKAKEGAQAVKSLLGSADERVRETALHTLGEIGDGSYVDAVAKAALEDEVPLVRLAAVQALGNLGDAKGVPTLVQMLYIEQPNASYYAPARFALVQVGAPAVPELLQTLKRENKTVEALKMPDGKPVPDGLVEAKSASTLGALGAKDAFGPMTEAFKKLYDKAKKGGPKSTPYAAVVELAYALGNLGVPGASAVLLPLAKDADGNLRIAGCEALITVGDREVAGQLVAAAKTGDPIARRAALVAASRLGGQAEIASFEALAKAGDKTTPNEIMSQMVEEEKVRLLAAKECQRNAACWKGKLGDGNPKVRERAAYELGWLEAKDTSADLVKLAEDPDAEVRMAAVLSLHRIGGADPQKLQAIYDQWQSKLEYAGVNQELLRLIARAKSKNKK